MSNTTMPSAPNRRLLAIFALLVGVLAAIGSGYVRATQDNPPAWLDLKSSLICAAWGLAFWVYPEALGQYSAWRLRFISFFFGMSALGLILYFV